VILLNTVKLLLIAVSVAVVWALEGDEPFTTFEG